MSTAPLGDRLRRDTPYGVSSDEKASSPTPCPRSGQVRPAWLWHGHCCPLDKETRRSYGIGCVEYHRLLEAQGGVCAVCGRRPGKWRLAVDHDHGTGAIRGLCHHRCQRGITTDVIRYLADPPGRQFGLVVPEAKLRRLEARDRAKRDRAAKRAKDRATKGRPRPPAGESPGLARMRAMTKQGGR